MGQVPNDILAVLRRGAMLDFEAEPTGEPLTGGVSSDIWRVDLPAGPVCVKRALAKLEVSGRLARTGRAQRLRGALDARSRAAVVPGCGARRCLCIDEAAGALAMQLLPARPLSLVEDACCATATPIRHSPRRVARTLVRDPCRHRRATRTIAARFPTDAIFHDIRLEPYLLATGRAHPDLAPALGRLRRRTATTKRALVHGDVSPKNILLRAGRARCSSMPSAPGRATRRSISPSASTICC